MLVCQFWHMLVCVSFWNYCTTYWHWYNETKWAHCLRLKSLNYCPISVLESILLHLLEGLTFWFWNHCFVNDSCCQTGRLWHFSACHALWGRWRLAVGSWNIFQGGVYSLVVLLKSYKYWCSFWKHVVMISFVMLPLLLWPFNWKMAGVVTVIYYSYKNAVIPCLYFYLYLQCYGEFII